MCIRDSYSDDWATYTLCEFMYSHFKLFACQPVIFCNVLDIATAKEASAAVPHQYQCCLFDAMFFRYLCQCLHRTDISLSLIHI